MSIFLLLLDLSGKSKWLKPLALITLVFSVIGLSNLGGLFGLLNARVFTNGLFAPVSFILTGLIGSIYLIIILLELHYRHHFPEKIKPVMDSVTKILGILIVAAILLTAWKYITSVFGGIPGRADVAMHILGSWATWLELILAFGIPLIAVIVGHGKETKMLFWASVGGMIGLFIMRYNLVHFTQVKPLQMMKTREYQLPPQWIEYTPSVTEWMFSIGAFGVAMLIYYVISKLFDLDHRAH
jgi:molybdopterin-containing oxidoreductase family membrane subunit